jgi:hypothetical protein
MIEARRRHEHNPEGPLRDSKVRAVLLNPDHHFYAPEFAFVETMNNSLASHKDDPWNIYIETAPVAFHCNGKGCCLGGAAEDRGQRFS